MWLLTLILLASCTPDKSTVAPSDGKLPQRIISLSPSTTEVLYGVGAFERVVAVSRYCDYPEQAKALPKVGDWAATNNEFLLSLKPDLVVVPSPQVPFVKDRLAALSIPMLEVPSQSLDDALNSITLIGKATGNVAEAQKLFDETKAQLETVKASVKDKPRPRVLLVADRVPGSLRGMYVATGDSFLAQLVEVAGGEVLRPPDSGTGYVQLSKEALAAFNPEVIIDFVQTREDAMSENTLEVWREMPTLRAVQTGNIVSMRGETYALHPSQFVGATARRFREILHGQQ